MVHKLVVLGIVAFLVAGCASTPMQTATPTSEDVSQATSGPSAFQTIRTTDTLYFADGSRLSPLPPTGPGQNSQLGTDVAELDPTGTAVKSPSWGFILDEARLFGEVNVTLWVDVEGTAVADPTTAHCFWTVLFQAKLADGSQYASTGCAAEPAGVVATGVRRLDARLDLSSLDDLVGGTDLAFKPYINGFLGADANVSLLYGSAEHPTQVTMPGLQLQHTDQLLKVN